jgi:DNA-binding transcriptional MerR regulator
MKKLYSTRELAKLFNVSEQLMRYYLLLPAMKLNPVMHGCYKRFSAGDVRRLAKWFSRHCGIDDPKKQAADIVLQQLTTNAAEKAKDKHDEELFKTMGFIKEE